MTWNHRIVCDTTAPADEQTYALSEVYYNDAGKPYGYCDPFTHGDTLGEVTDLIARLERATREPVLYWPNDFDLTPAKKRTEEPAYLYARAIRANS